MSPNLSSLCLDLPMKNIDFSVEFNLYNHSPLFFGIGDNLATANHFSFRRGWTSSSGSNEDVLVVTAELSECHEQIIISTHIPHHESYLSIKEYLIHLWDGQVMYPTDISMGSGNGHFTLSLDIGYHDIKKINKTSIGATFHDISYSRFFCDTYRPASFNARDHEDFISFDGVQYSKDVEPIIDIDRVSGNVFFGNKDYIETYYDSIGSRSSYFYRPDSCSGDLRIMRHGRYICYDGFHYDLREKWRRMDEIKQEGFALALKHALEEEFIRNGQWTLSNLLVRDVNRSINVNIDKIFKEFTLNDNIIF